MTVAELDTAAVGRWLAGRLTGFDAAVTAEKFAGGQSNPTFRLITQAGDYVLRRKPPGKLLKSAHAVEREYRVQRALVTTDVPVPVMHALCEDDSVIGTAFYIMAHVQGCNFDDPRLPDLTVGERAAIFDEMNRILAAIHGVDLSAAGLTDYGRPGNYYRRQIDRWTGQYRASETETLADMDALIDWLDGNAPEDDGRACLVHGDYRLDNLIFASDSPACLAVLDWELSTLGHPFADLAQVLMQWGRPAGRAGRGLAGVNRAALGIPEDDSFIDAYCARAGLPGIPDFGFYLAFAHFRFAAILQGVKKRALEGNASNPARAREMGNHIPGIAAAGLAAAATA